MIKRILCLSLLCMPMAVWGAWSAPTTISNPSIDSSESETAINSSGTGISVWTIWDGSNNRIAAAIYDGSWNTASLISASGIDSVSPRVGIDDAGNILAVWNEYNGTNFFVKGALYSSSSSTWGTPITLSNTGVDSLYPEMAMNGNGDALVAWSYYDGNNYIGQAVDYTSGSWGSIQAFSSTGQDITDMRLDLSNNGNGVAVWNPYDGSNYVILAAEYSSGSWGSPTQISSANTDASNPYITLNNLGNGIASWAQANGDWTIASKVINSGVWDTNVTKLSATGTNPFLPKNSYNDAGDAMVIWNQFDENYNLVIAGRGYSSGTSSWNSIQQISTLNQSSDYTSAVRVNNASTAIAMSIWSEYSGSNYVIVSSVYSFSNDSWSTIEGVSSASYDSLNPTFDLNDAGDALASWDTYNGTTWEIQAAVGNF